MTCAQRREESDSYNELHFLIIRSSQLLKSHQIIAMSRRLILFHSVGYMSHNVAKCRGDEKWAGAVHTPHSADWSIHRSPLNIRFLHEWHSEERTEWMWDTQDKL